MEAALERLGGHVALLSRLLGLFAHDFAASLQQIQDASDAGDLSRAADLVHKIRGAAGNLSANDLFKTATVLEERLRQEGAAWSDPLLAFSQAFNIVMTSARIETASRDAEMVQTP
jgi:HPt (histidine-containing phosphotransfer) domain-containing protein